MTGKREPHGALIYERAYWRDPVQVFGGMTWLVIGIAIGVLL